MKKEDLKNHLNRAKEELVSNLAAIRTGRANQAILDGVMVEAYPGTAPLPINELATITIPDAQSILISPWDKSIMRRIEEGIRKSPKNLNPVNEGETIRIPVPALTEESRKEKVKEVSKKVEEAKIVVRTLRQNAMSAVEEMEENGVISEDDMYRQKEEIEKMIKESNLLFEQIGKEKEKELMQI